MAANVLAEPIDRLLGRAQKMNVEDIDALKTSFAEAQIDIRVKMEGLERIMQARMAEERALVMSESLPEPFRSEMRNVIIKAATAEADAAIAAAEKITGA